ncbi:protein lines-like, partial [Contarinia nasturtii]|uniref:protein lines-like n=1 Tax=Contarinia nasturtii TaxID=265458 RepID=UPI0012D389AF
MDALNATNEQPMSKRQKIDASENNKKGVFSEIFNGIDNTKNRNSDNTPPDILPITNHEHNGNTNVSPNSNDLSGSIASYIKIRNSSSSIHSSPSGSPNDELDNSVACNVIRSIDSTEKCHRNHEFPDLLKTSPDIPSTSQSHEIFTLKTVASCGHRKNSTINETSSSRLSSIDSNNFSCLYNAEEFQLNLMKQCLCDIDKSAFAAFRQRVRSEPKQLLMEWPANQLIQCLSNMELLFEVYLNQNAKGEICQRVMMACDEILWQNQIIDEITDLDGYNNKFVQYLATKVLANCLLIVKDKKPYCEDLLNSLMDKLITRADQLTEHRSLGKMSFILGIILHIMEWKDIKKHPLDDQIVINGREVYNDSDNETYSLPINIPRIEDNYFAVHHSEDETETPMAPTAPVEAHILNRNEHEHQLNHSNDSQRVSCRLKYLKDSESFDSNDLKISILKKLKTKWYNLVFKIRTLLQSNRNLQYNENTVVTFLTLWERIISVDSCIEYESTVPFHLHLQELTRILIEGKLPTQIYKQILTLFSASLCYTTTLALQP